jgi:hypothetical protein
VEQRIGWDDLDEPLKQAIEVRTGPITRVRIVTAGQNSPLAATVHTRDGKVFIKGLPSDHPSVIHSSPRGRRFAGPVLTHSDWTPDNVLVSAHRAWLIDWAWPTFGAGWTDPACCVLRLMASGGHTAHEAERQASRLPAFAAADPAHIDLFAAANVRLWAEVAQSSTSTWTTKMAQAAQSWSAHRLIDAACLDWRGSR